MFKGIKGLRPAVIILAMSAVILSGCLYVKLPLSLPAGEDTENTESTEVIVSEEKSGPEEAKEADTKYMLYRFGNEDSQVELEDLFYYGLESSYIEFKTDGTGVFKFGDEKSDFRWEKTGSIFMNNDGSARFEVHGDVVHVLSFGQIFTFVRKGVKLAQKDIPAIEDTELMYYFEEKGSDDILGHNVDEAGNVLGVIGGEDAVDDEEAFSYYEQSPFYVRLCETYDEIRFTRSRAVAIARSQIGYHEGNKNSELDGLNALGESDYTEYGRFCETQGQYWGSEFVSWCIRLSGVPEDLFTGSIVASADGFDETGYAMIYEWEDTVYGGGYYYPQEGDILLIQFNQDSFSPSDALAQSALIESVTKNSDGTVSFRVIQGNAHDAVMESDYIFEIPSGNMTDCDGRFCYIVSPEYGYGLNLRHCTLAFDVNGGIDYAACKTVYPGGLYGPLPIATKPNATFDGWYTQKEGGEKITMYSTFNGSGRPTLYAHWK